MCTCVMVPCACVTVPCACVTVLCASQGSIHWGGGGEASNPNSPASTPKIPTVVQITTEKALLECQNLEWSKMASDLVQSKTSNFP